MFLKMSKGTTVGPQFWPDRAFLGKCMPHCPLSNKKKRRSFAQAVLAQFNAQPTALYIETDNINRLERTFIKEKFDYTFRQILIK